MIDFTNLTTWDIYKLMVNAKPLSPAKLKSTLEFDKQFDDMRFNDAVTTEFLDGIDFDFMHLNISISKAVYVGTGHYGEPMEYLGGDDHYKKGKRIPGTIHYTAGINGDIVDESIMEYKSFEDALQAALYGVKEWNRIWEPMVKEVIYQNNRNPDKYLSVFEFGSGKWVEYSVLQYIEKSNPKTGELVRNNVGTKLGDDTHVQYSKSDLDHLLEDYHLAGSDTSDLVYL